MNSENQDPDPVRSDVSAEAPTTRAGAKFMAVAGFWPDIAVTALIGLILYAGLLWFAVSFEQGGRLDVLLLAGIFGTTIGWTVGIFSSPVKPGEQREKPGYTNLVYAFVAGYVLSKVDPAITHGIETGIQTTVAVFGFTSFLIALALTYVIRRHWN